MSLYTQDALVQETSAAAQELAKRVTIEEADTTIIDLADALADKVFDLTGLAAGHGLSHDDVHVLTTHAFHTDEIAERAIAAESILQSKREELPATLGLTLLDLFEFQKADSEEKAFAARVFAGSALSLHAAIAA